MTTEVNYRGSGVIVSETATPNTTSSSVQVRPQGVNSGWMYMHRSSLDKLWMTYHIHKVETIKITKNLGVLSDNSTVAVDIHTGYGEYITIFLNGASIDMIAEAVTSAQNVVAEQP